MTGLILNLLLLSGFGGYFLLNGSPEIAVASAAGPKQLAPSEYLRVEIDLPSPTPTAPAPTRTPVPSLGSPPIPLDSFGQPVPASFLITDITGKRQSLPLSCESRSAVDWAAYFGETIDEIEFFEGLPQGDNPEEGFVGDVFGSWGQIPPEAYGVHAGPVAQRLREYGLNAKAVREFTWEELQAELAAGQPVILWVVGHIARGTPVPYTSSDGHETTVARFEHTVIAIGYSEYKITVLDGAKVYDRHKGEFLKSWGVLENQAVIWID